MSHLRNLIIGAMLDALDDNMLAKHHVDIEQMADDALAAVAPLIRRAALEEAAAWHDEQAGGEDALAKASLGLDDADYRLHRHFAREHRLSAAAIRALDT